MTEEQNARLADLFRRMEAKGWPTLEDDHKACMERAREFLDEAERIVPNE